MRVLPVQEEIYWSGKTAVHTGLVLLKQYCFRIHTRVKIHTGQEQTICKPKPAGIWQLLGKCPGGDSAKILTGMLI